MSNRGRPETLSSLGRSPARTSVKIPLPPAPQPAPERGGAIRRFLHGALFDNVGLKFLSMVLAVTVFLLVNTDKEQEITAKIGIGYTLPDDKVLVSDRIDELRVTIRGPRRRLQHFDESSVPRVDVDLRRGDTGNVLITPDMIHLPAGLTVTSITPRNVHVAFDKRVEKVVVVEPKTDGQPQHGFFMASAKVTPPTIQVRGAESTLSSLSSVSTASLSLENRTESFVAETTVVPPDGVDVVGSPRVTVAVQIDEMLVRSAIVGMDVAVRGDGEAAKWTVMPAQVNITLTGALLAVEKAKNEIAAYVKIGGDGQPASAAAKPREVDVQIDGLPPGIGATISPERVKLTPAKPAPSP
ncbi:MAG TPA: CdaR family protein [Kofleriaceae bacterium]|jgi:YbbR domain-containing protein